MSELPKKLIFVEYVDHWENGNLTLDAEAIRRKIEKPITLKSLGQIKEENDEFLVVEHFQPRKYDFIFKPAIRIQEIYHSNEDVFKLKEKYEKRKRELGAKLTNVTFRLWRKCSQLQLINRERRERTREMLENLKQYFDSHS
ncbi:MAG: hypothetical protein ACTSQI_22145 [Candidatus Helarchaeota archaeon]